MAVQFQEYYETLGVGRTASEAQISKAYRKLARKYHPDVSKEKGAEEKFKQIAEAYAVLKDPEKRKKYDALGSNWQSGEDFTPPPGWQDFHFDYHDGAATGRKAGVWPWQRGRRLQRFFCNALWRRRVSASLVSDVPILVQTEGPGLRVHRRKKRMSPSVLKRRIVERRGTLSYKRWSTAQTEPSGRFPENMR